VRDEFKSAFGHKPIVSKGGFWH